MRSAESQPSISAVVVTHNSAACVERCLESITEHLQPSQIIVVDNASTDGTVEAVRRASVLSIVIETGTNLGFGNACNLAVIEASSDVVVFVNPSKSNSSNRSSGCSFRCSRAPQRKKHGTKSSRIAHGFRRFFAKRGSISGLASSSAPAVRHIPFRMPGPLRRYCSFAEKSSSMSVDSTLDTSCTRRI
jgi:hypothetical protein